MSKIQIFREEIDVDSFDDKGLPSDIHLVHFTKEDGTAQVDAVRAYTMVDIFDVYHDKKYKVSAINSGYGNVRPNMFGKIKQGEWLPSLSALYLWHALQSGTLIHRLDI